VQVAATAASSDVSILFERFHTGSEGDVVTVGECRPLSKTVRFNVLKVEAATEAGAIRAKKTFRVF
jgi:small subunit ribosomal protein S11e